MELSNYAGKLAENWMLVNIPELVTAYYSEQPEPQIPEQRVAFGTSGHRGSSLKKSFCEGHILAICQAICDYRKQKKIEGPLFLGIDTHALSFPAYTSAVEVFSANGVELMLAKEHEYTPTPAVSHAILTYNRDRSTGLADGVVITPSHNPPGDGGFKYNSPNGGPAGTEVTNWIGEKANEYLTNKLRGIQRISYEKAISAANTHRHDFLSSYVSGLASIIDMGEIARSSIRVGVDPLGGAGVHYWGRIAEEYGLQLTVVNKTVDPTFRFMTVDWDGQIRMDPSSSYAMQGLIALKDQFDLSVACDTDHDRHGIVTQSSGLLPPNHFLASAIAYLMSHRPAWSPLAGVGKTVVSTRMIDLVVAKAGRKLFEVPVGFKWFVDGLLDGSLLVVGEESAGASLARMDGSVWTTDKDGMVMALLAAEMTAVTGLDPGQQYKALTAVLGAPVYDRVEAPANAIQKKKLAMLSPAQILQKELAGEQIKEISTAAPGNHAAIGGIKVSTENGWFAARPSGTEDLYKIYAESFLGDEHLKKLLAEAQVVVDAALKNG